MGVSFLPTSAFAIGYGGIGGEPAYPDASVPKSDSIFPFVLHAGENADSGIRVMNNTDEEKRIILSAVDSETATGGAFSCKAKDSEKEEVGTWIALESNTVSLPPFSNVIVPFRISLPVDVSPGSHEGCLVLEDADQVPEEQGGILLRFRTGIRVSVTVPGDIHEEIRPAGLSVSFRQKGEEETKILLQPKVQNVGNVSLETTVEVSTQSFFSWWNPIVQSALFSVSKGEIADWNFEIPSPFWGGIYRTESTFEYETNQYFQGLEEAKPMYTTSLQSNLFLEKEEEKQYSISSLGTVRIPGERVWFFVAPSPVAMAIEVSFLSFLLFLAFFQWISHWRKKWIRSCWIPYTIQKGETLPILADRYDVAWKIVAKANKIQAPYHLRPGEKILLPPEEQ